MRMVYQENWLCVSCFHQMTSVTDLSGKGRLGEGSLAMCNRCGFLHIRIDREWLSPERKELQRLALNIRLEVLIFQIAQKELGERLTLRQMEEIKDGMGRDTDRT